MIHYFLPTAKNNYKAYLLKIPALLTIALVIASFNFFVKIDTKAESVGEILNSQNLLLAHNNVRKDLNIGTLTLNPKLSLSAQNKAQKLLESNCWSHYCPDGKSPWDFFTDEGYDYAVAGENLGEGFYNTSDLMTAWMNSQTHKENIINPAFKDVGFGIVSGNYQGIENNVIVVVHFGTEVNTVLQDNSKQITITAPHNGDTLHNNSTKVEGTVQGVNNVDIYLNGSQTGKADINNGLFTYNLTALKEGDNYIYAQTTLDYGLSKDSNVIKVTYNNSGENLVIADQPINISTNGVSSTPELKNAINIIFIAGLASLFLLDFLVLSRTSILEKERSYAHYHFGLLFILAIIILAGGFSGNISQAISI